MKKKIGIICIISLAILAVTTVWHQTRNHIYIRRNHYYNTKAMQKCDNPRIYTSRRGRITSSNVDLDFQLDGQDTIWQINTIEKSDITLNYTLNTKEGITKILHIHPDNTEITIAENTAIGSYTTTLKPGTHKIRLIGISTRAQIQISIQDNPNTIITLEADSDSDEDDPSEQPYLINIQNI